LKFLVFAKEFLGLSEGRSPVSVSGAKTHRLKKIKGDHAVSISAELATLFLVSLSFAATLPLSAKSDEAKPNDQNERETKGKDQIVIVLYEGPLSHDQNWTIKHGAQGADNQKFRDLGGTCSMVSSDVSNLFGFERVTFEADRKSLGLWKMSWTDTVSGEATDGNHYKYQQHIEFIGLTTDGLVPKPNRKAPSDGNAGFLQIVPDNVNTDSLDLTDLFILHSQEGKVIASSHVHSIFRQQIPPEALDPPPSYFPYVISGRYILNIPQQSAGQLGCDPL
jgi:hypothetical protein